MHDEFLQRFGAHVRKLRAEAGLSQEALAAKAGIHRTYMGGIERGERNICLKNIVRLAAALGLEPPGLVRQPRNKMIDSPYSGKAESAWYAITKRLVNKHPLKLAVLREAALSTWTSLWQTTVGDGATSVRLADLRVPATVVGYFFEVLLARELQQRSPEIWRGTISKDEKDLVYLPEPSLSVEIKTSGQAGFKVYGNRSYGQKSGSDSTAKKEKSGYYITVNFYNQILTLIRFGWIDADDWDPQEAPTGQMAGLKKTVYDNKLFSVPGSYRQAAPAILLDGIGPKTAEDLAQLGIHTIGDLIHYPSELPPRFARIRNANRQFLRRLCGSVAGLVGKQPGSFVRQISLDPSCRNFAILGLDFDSKKPSPVLKCRNCDCTRSHEGI